MLQDFFVFTSRMGCLGIHVCVLVAGEHWESYYKRNFDVGVMLQKLITHLKHPGGGRIVGLW